MSEFGHILGALEPWVHHYGVAAVFVVLTFESFGVPLPGESLLLVAAILAGRGEISLVGLVLSAWAGAVAGDNIGYVLGRLLGRRLLLRWGGKVGLSEERLQKVEAVFTRYGPMTVGLARFFNVLRQLNGIVAGSVKMDWRRFLVFNALGGALWVLAWTAAGYYLGSHGADITAFMHKAGYLSAAVALAAVIAIIALVYRNNVRTRRRRSLVHHDGTQPE